MLTLEALMRFSDSWWLLLTSPPSADVAMSREVLAAEVDRNHVDS